MHERLLGYIKRISQILGKKATFGIYDRDDIEQEIFLLVYAAQPEYDSTKGDEFSFYYHHCSKRLLTLKRNKHINPKIKKNEGKIKLLRAGEIDGRSAIQYENNETNAIGAADFVDDVIDKKIPAGMRLNYLRLLEGVDIPYHDKSKLLDAIKVIVRANNDKE